MAEDLNDPFKLFRDMWKPLEMTGAASSGVPPMFSVEDLEKKINELKVIEGWLTVNVNMLQMSIKTMEMQKAALQTLQQAAAPADPNKR
ncbi:hypothetical protein LIN78_13765 [Leeia sp. TBRC 13508]|uniref:Uncharacterized protein n=1 Tax=Leeia speluncae TaxID=2884804 RepID=A0ABS8D8W1_9NEIS|nr:PhaM family polyhydroxyalkanoate granule multifunctional regulatory protein [Leeia speluncae]MCB6184609.1 hypothetical protein [Leeia speluncae]